MSGKLLVPLLRRCGVGSLGLDARCRRCIGCLGCHIANGCRSGVKLSESRVRDSGVGNTLKRFVFRRDSLRLCDLVNPSFLCGERSLFEGCLLDLGVCISVSVIGAVGSQVKTYK